MKAETENVVKSVREEKVQTQSSLETIIKDARARFEQQEVKIQKMVREHGGPAKSSRLVRGKDMQLERLQDNPSKNDFGEWLFNLDLYLESHEDWAEANQVMMRIRRLTADIDLKEYKKMVQEVADSEFDEGFIEDDWKDYGTNPGNCAT